MGVEGVSCHIKAATLNARTHQSSGEEGGDDAVHVHFPPFEVRGWRWHMRRAGHRHLQGVTERVKERGVSGGQRGGGVSGWVERSE